jgi:hypothetical protein
MKSTSSDITTVAQNFLKEKEIVYTTLGEPKFEILPTDGIDEPHWTVPYEYKVFEIEVAFIKIEDESTNVLHVLTKHGKRYLNGGSAFEKEKVDDDENWDDL